MTLATRQCRGAKTGSTHVRHVGLTRTLTRAAPRSSPSTSEPATRLRSPPPTPPAVRLPAAAADNDDDDDDTGDVPPSCRWDWSAGSSPRSKPSSSVTSRPSPPTPPPPLPPPAPAGSGSMAPSSSPESNPDPDPKTVRLRRWTRELDPDLPMGRSPRLAAQRPAWSCTRGSAPAASSCSAAAASQPRIAMWSAFCPATCVGGWVAGGGHGGRSRGEVGLENTACASTAQPAPPECDLGCPCCHHVPRRHRNPPCK